MAENHEVHLAELSSHVKQLQDICDDIKDTITPQLRQMNENLAQLNVHHTNHQKEILTMWATIDTLRSTASTAESKADGIKNSMRGALWAGGIAFTICQMAISAAFGWVFVNLSESVSINRVQTYREEVIEANIKALQSQQDIINHRINRLGGSRSYGDNEGNPR